MTDLLPEASPGPTAGCGLKPESADALEELGDASPGPTAGCGLKLQDKQMQEIEAMHHPAQQPGVD